MSVADRIHRYEHDFDCVDCETRKANYKSARVCERCYKRRRRNQEGVNPHGSRQAAIYDDYQEMRFDGVSKENAARRMGIKTDSLDRSLAREMKKRGIPNTRERQRARLDALVPVWLDAQEAGVSITAFCRRNQIDTTALRNAVERSLR